MFEIYRKSFAVFCLSAAVGASGCQQVQNFGKPPTVAPASLRDVPAQRLSFRFEPDVLPPPETQNAAPMPEKLTAIQADFDANRPQDALERTILSADKQRALAIYQLIADEPGNFRLDLYDAAGKLIRKITPPNLTLRFPDSAVWSPDNGNFAFAGARTTANAAPNSQATVPGEIVQEAPRPPDLTDAGGSPDPNVSPTAAPSPVQIPTTVLTFSTEQIYLANRDGGELKPLTQTDGLIYFKFIWSPDGAQLAALACKSNEWQYLQTQAVQAGEVFKPLGRPRVLEKNGRERRLDDALTGVEPVWSPDSSKLASAFDKQIRIYDAIGSAPTAAALPLQVPLLLAAKICDEKVAANQSCVNAAAAEVNQNAADMPATSQFVTFNPIIALRWAEDQTLYLETGYFKDFLKEESVHSFPRWHRLNFSPQAAILK